MGLRVYFALLREGNLLNSEVQTRPGLGTLSGGMGTLKLKLR